MCRSLGAVLADIMEIQCTRRTSQFLNREKSASQMNLAQAALSGAENPEAAYLVFCRQRSRLGRAVLLVRRRRYLHRQRSATEYRIY